MQGITTAFDREDRRGFVRKRLLALVIVLCLVAAATMVGCFLVFGPYLERWLGGATSQPGLVAWVWWTAQWPVLILTLLAAFAVLLYLGPDVDQPSWKWVTPGAVVALAIWLLASGAFSLYASHFGSYQKTWGSLSAVVVMLIWLWLTNVALLLGAEVNAETERLAAERAGTGPQPVPSPKRQRDGELLYPTLSDSTTDRSDCREAGCRVAADRERMVEDVVERRCRVHLSSDPPVRL